MFGLRRVKQGIAAVGSARLIEDVNAVEELNGAAL